jgi:hypothetical protein
MKHTFRSLILALLFISGAANAEQMRKLGDWEVHYVLVPTTFLNKDVAANYQIARGRDRALVNISILDEAGNPVAAEVTGRVTNLLSQSTELNFSEVTEGPAVYYLADVKHTDRDILRFEIQIIPPDQTTQLLKFQQRVYWEGR